MANLDLWRQGYSKLCFVQQNGVTPVESKHIFPLHYAHSFASLDLGALRQRDLK